MTDGKPFKVDVFGEEYSKMQNSFDTINPDKFDHILEHLK